LYIVFLLSFANKIITVGIIIKDNSPLDSATKDMMNCPRGVYPSFV